MSATPARLNLFVDVFELKGQPAKALPTLMPTDLITAILEEFRELEFLSDQAADYRLLKINGRDRMPLDEHRALSEQLASGDRLTLVELGTARPQGTERPAKHLYLREQDTGKVYKMHWLPAIIGRPDDRQTHNERLAVDLSSHVTGLRVSRRHAQITETDGQYYIECLSQNPLRIKDTQGNITSVEVQKQPIRHGDVIHLERSDIALKFIVREKEVVA